MPGRASGLNNRRMTATTTGGGPFGKDRTAMNRQQTEGAYGPPVSQTDIHQEGPALVSVWCLAHPADPGPRLAEVGLVYRKGEQRPGGDPGPSRWGKR
jgi:hypothetical protein